MAGLTDSGARESFNTGAIRERAEGKGRYDLIPPEALKALALVFEAGAKKYADRNWEKGIPLYTCLDSAMRHLVQLTNGEEDEDHAALVMSNMCMFIALRERAKEPESKTDWDNVKLEYSADGMTIKPEDIDVTQVQGVGRWVSENRCGDGDFKAEHPHMAHQYGTDAFDHPVKCVHRRGNPGCYWCDGYVVEPVAVQGESYVDVVKRVADKLMQPRPIRDNPQA